MRRRVSALRLLMGRNTSEMPRLLVQCNLMSPSLSAGERRPNLARFSQLSFLTRSCAIYTSQGRDAAFRSSSCARGRGRHFGELGG